MNLQIHVCTEVVHFKQICPEYTHYSSRITETEKQCIKMNILKINILRLKRISVSAGFLRLQGRRKWRVTGLDPELSGSDLMPDCCCYLGDYFYPDV